MSVRSHSATLSRSRCRFAPSPRLTHGRPHHCLALPTVVRNSALPYAHRHALPDTYSIWAVKRDEFTDAELNTTTAAPAKPSIPAAKPPTTA